MPADKAAEAVVPLTNAQFARYVAIIARAATMQAVDLADGMWNPNFCAASAEPKAASFIEDIRRYLAAIERTAGRMKEQQP